MPVPFLPDDPMMEPTDDERQAALSAALRKQQGLGLLAQLTGDKVLGNVGGSLLTGAEHGMARADRFQERKLALALDAKKDKEMQQYRADTLRQHADDMRQRALDRGLSRDALTDARTEREEAKRTKQEQDELDKFGKDITEAHGRGSELVANTKRMNASQRVLSGALDKSGGVKKDLTQQQVRALVADYQAMMGASNAEGALEAIVPKTFEGDVKAFYGYVTGNPQSAEVADMLGQFVDQAHGEEATIRAQNRGLIGQELLTHSALVKRNKTAQNMLKGHGVELSDLDPDTLLPKSNLDPVQAGIAARDESQKTRKAISRIEKLRADGLSDEAIKTQLIKEGF